jgi:hypothetical protein
LPLLKSENNFDFNLIDFQRNFGRAGAALRCTILEEPEQHLGAIF